MKEGGIGEYIGLLDVTGASALNDLVVSQIIYNWQAICLLLCFKYLLPDVAVVKVYLLIFCFESCLEPIPFVWVYHLVDPAFRDLWRSNNVCHGVVNHLCNALVGD